MDNATVAGAPALVTGHQPFNYSRPDVVSVTPIPYDASCDVFSPLACPCGICVSRSCQCEFRARAGPPMRHMRPARAAIQILFVARPFVLMRIRISRSYDASGGEELVIEGNNFGETETPAAVLLNEEPCANASWRVDPSEHGGVPYVRAQ